MKTLSHAAKVHVSPDDKSGERYVEIIGSPLAQYFVSISATMFILLYSATV